MAEIRLAFIRCFSDSLEAAISTFSKLLNLIYCLERDKTHPRTLLPDTFLAQRL